MSASYSSGMNARRVLVPLAAVAGLVAMAPVALKRAFAPPRREVRVTPDDLGLPAEEVWLVTGNDRRLHAWFVPVDGPAPAVVVLHGWGGNASDMLPLAEPLRDAGFHGFFVDARNHGLSEHDDHMSMPRFAEDLEAAVRFVRARPQVTSVGVVGHSVGAAAALFAAARGAPIDAVVAVAAFAHPEELMERNFPFPRPVTKLILWMVERIIGYRYEEIAPRNRAAEVEAPVLLVHGDADAVVPVEDSHDLHARLPDSRLIVVPGAGHAELEPYEPYFPDVVGFLSEHLSTRVV